MRVFFVNSARHCIKAGIVVFLFSLFIFGFYWVVHNNQKEIVSAELFSGEYPEKLIILDKNALRVMDNELSKARSMIQKGQPEGKYTLTIYREKIKQTYIFDNPGRLFDLGNREWYLLSDNGKCLEHAIQCLKEKNPFGKFMKWEEVKKVFRKFDKARVVDFETGMSFMVQRRAGSSHADVQPLTAEDSAIMKTIYGGKWSWRRRAVIVEIRGQRIAASMNGMPHGAGAISGNNFRGHSCIHFRESRLHSNHEDLAHQLMVWKAAGVVEKMLAGAKPEKIILIFATAVDQADNELAGMLVQSSTPVQRSEVGDGLDNIKWLAVNKIEEVKTGDQQATRRVKVSCELRNGMRMTNKTFDLELIKGSQKTPWKIKAGEIIQLFQPQKQLK